MPARKCRDAALTTGEATPDSWLDRLIAADERVGGDPAPGLTGRALPSEQALREHRVANAPIAGHEPGLDSIEVRGAAGLFQLGDAPVLVQLRLRRLNVTLVVRATGHQHRLFAVPRPVEREPGMRLRMDRRLKLRFLP